MNVLNTDNICMLAILALDVRPSSVCVTKHSEQHFEVQVLRLEALGRPFEFYAKRFAGVIKSSFKGTNLGQVKFELKLVDELDYKFEAQRAWKLATDPIKVSP